MNRRYYIKTPSVTQQVKPLNITERVYKYNFHNKDGKYYYIKELDGALKFVGEDYVFLKDLDENGYGCNTITFEIYRDFADYSVLEYTGKIRLVDMKYDLDKCIIEAEAKPLTLYDPIETKGDKEINVLDLGISKHEISFLIGELETFDATTPYTMTNGNVGGVYPDYEDNAEPLFWTGGGDPPLLTGWRWYDLDETTQYFSAGGGYSEQSGLVKWVREVITIPSGDTPPVGFIEVQDLGATKKYARPVVLFERKQTGPTYSPPMTIPESYLKIEYKYTGQESKTTILRQALKFGDVIEAMLKEICGGTPEMVSNFLQWKPTTPSAINYVTGQPNRINNLYLIQKSDAKKPDATEAATNGKSQFSDFMKAVEALFDARYYFDNNGKFRIEHISSFSKSLELDLTIDGGKWCVGQRKYSYDINNMPRSEKYKCMEQGHIDFVGKPIEYTEACTQEKDETHNTNTITTDLIYVLSYPEKVSDEGWVLVACGEYDGKLYILQEDGVFHPAARSNNILAFSHLHRDFHKHNRVKKYGTLNGEAATFESVRPTKKAQAVSIPFRDITTFQPDQLVKGPLGEGTVAEAKYSLKQEMLEVTLLIEKIEPLPVDPVADKFYAKLVIGNIYDNSGIYPYGGPPLSNGCEVFIHLYEDAAGTIPFTPPVPVYVRIETKQYNNGTLYNTSVGNRRCDAAVNAFFNNPPIVTALTSYKYAAGNMDSLILVDDFYIAPSLFDEYEILDPELNLPSGLYMRLDWDNIATGSSDEEYEAIETGDLMIRCFADAAATTIATPGEIYMSIKKETKVNGIVTATDIINLNNYFKERRVGGETIEKSKYNISNGDFIEYVYTIEPNSRYTVI